MPGHEDEELSQLRQEWRTRMGNDMMGLREEMAKTREAVQTIRDEFVKLHAFNELNARVQKLENFRWMLVGGFTVLQVLISLVLKYLFK